MTLDFWRRAIASLILGAAAHVLAVGEQNYCLAARLLVHLLIGGQVDPRRLEQGPLGFPMEEWSRRRTECPPRDCCWRS